MSPRTPTPPDRDPADATDPSDPTDPTQEPVRRLLADARHTDPVPPAVAARLDAVLADLGAGREPGSGAAGEHGGAGVGDHGVRGAAPVDDLARRRRRRAVALLVAAVAVVAVGLTTDALRGDDAGGADSAGGSASSARTDPADPGGSAGSAGSAESAEPPAAAPETLDQGGGSTGDRARARPFVVRADAFVRDVRRLRSAPGTRVQSAARVVGEGALGAGPGFVCSPPTAYGAGRLVPVRYQGGAAVLAYRVPTGATQTVDLLQCGTAQVLRSTTLPRS